MRFMSDTTRNSDFFDDDFEVTYTEDIPPVSFDTRAFYDETYDAYYDEDDFEEDEVEDTYEKAPRRRPRAPHPEERASRPPKRRPAASAPAKPRRKKPSSDLASPIRKPFQKGTRAVEQFSRFVLRPAPILCAAVITLITVFSFWNGHAAYGDLALISEEQNYTLLAYLTVGGILVFWEVSSFLFALSGLWTGRGRGLTFFLLVYVGSYIASLAGGLIPDGIDVIIGVKGGLSVYGNLYPMFFPFCAVGLVSCILKNIFE